MSRLTNKDWKNPENLMWIKLGSIHMRDEGYRTFLSEALRKLAYYEDLEKQVPKKSFPKTDIETEHGYWTWKCPNCGDEWLFRYNYCSSCGQRLDWRVEND